MNELLFFVFAGIAVLALTLFITPRYIKIARSRGLVGKDMNKYTRPEVAESGGIAVFSSFIIGMLMIVVFYLLNNETGNIQFLSAVITSSSIIALIAYMDDIGGWKKGFVRWKKPILTIVASLPLVPLVLERSSINILGYGVDLPFLFYPLILVPIGFIGATNAVNLLAGFNGLETGLGITCTLTLAWFTFGTVFFPVLLISAFALMGFLWFNKYPSRIFPGDTLTYFLGGLMAIVAVLGHFQTVTLLIMAPYLLEGLIKSREIPYIIRHKKTFKPECFGSVSKDGSMVAPYKQIWSLTHVAIRVIRRIKGNCFENDVTIFIVGLHALWCMLIILVFG